MFTYTTVELGLVIWLSWPFENQNFNSFNQNQSPTEQLWTIPIPNVFIIQATTVPDFLCLIMI